MNQQLIDKYKTLEKNRQLSIFYGMTEEKTSEITESMLALWHVMTEEEQTEVVGENTRQESPLWRYVRLVNQHHEVIFLHRGKGTPRELSIRMELEKIWAGLNRDAHAFLSRVVAEAETVPNLSHPTNDESSQMILAISNVLSRTLHDLKDRTQSLIFRRMGGNTPIDDAELLDPYKIFSVEAQIPQTWYRNCKPSAFMGHYVKVGLAVTGGSTPYEYVWVDQIAFYDEPDSSVSEPDQLSGVLIDAPTLAEGFERGDIVTFKAREIQDKQLAEGFDSTNVHDQYQEEGLSAIVELLLDAPAFKGNPISKEMAEKAWFNMSDREAKHIISFIRGMKARGMA